MSTAIDSRARSALMSGAGHETHAAEGVGRVAPGGLRAREETPAPSARRVPAVVPLVLLLAVHAATLAAALVAAFPH